MWRDGPNGLGSGRHCETGRHRFKQFQAVEEGRDPLNWLWMQPDRPGGPTRVESSTPSLRIADRGITCAAQGWPRRIHENGSGWI